jgi:hypothetical protein
MPVELARQVKWYAEEYAHTVADTRASLALPC